MFLCLISSFFHPVCFLTPACARGCPNGEMEKDKRMRGGKKTNTHNTSLYVYKLKHPEQGPGERGVPGRGGSYLGRCWTSDAPQSLLGCCNFFFAASPARLAACACCTVRLGSAILRLRAHACIHTRACTRVRCARTHVGAMHACKQASTQPHRQICSLWEKKTQRKMFESSNNFILWCV